MNATVAEDHFLHGHLLAGWVVDYIDLEESLAVGSLAQEELAHAATVLRLAGLDDAARDAFVYERPAEQWYPTRLLGRRLHDWPATVLRGVLLSRAALVRSEALVGSQSAAAREAGAVLAAEQQLHVLHWERWLGLLGRDARTGAELRRCAAEVLPLGRDVFADEAGLHRAWAGAVAAAFGEAFGTGGGAEVRGALGEEPVGRVSAAEHPELLEMLAELRSVRVGAGDGVRGLYR